MASAATDGSPHCLQELVNIEWKEYGDALRVGIWKLFVEQMLVDVSLSSCAGLKVHKFILALFFGGMSKKLTSKLQLHATDTTNMEACEIGIEDLDVDANVHWDAEAVRILFEFSYSGKVSIPADNLVKVLGLAEAVGFDGLVDSIREHLDGGKRPIKEELVGDDFLPDDQQDDPSRLRFSRRSAHAAEPRETANEEPVKRRKNSRKGTPMKITYVRQSRSKTAALQREEPVHISNSNDARTVSRRKLVPARRQQKVPVSKSLVSTSDDDEDVRPPIEHTDSSSNESESDEGGRDGDYNNDDDDDDDDDGDDENETEEDNNEEERVQDGDFLEDNEDEDDQDDDDDDDDDYEDEEQQAKKRKKRKPVAGKKRSISRDKIKRTTKTAKKTKCSTKGVKKKKKRVKLECAKCNYSTTDKVTYQNHLAKHDPTLEVQRFECNVCSKSFRSRKGYRCHMKTHGDPDEQYQCAHCQFSTPQKWSWRQHMAVMHKVDAESGRELIANFRCDKCDFECVAGHQLKAHLLRKHSLEKQYKCAECPYETIYRSQLEKHISVSHRKERHYMCETCGFRSQTHSGLTRHKRAHLGLKPFKCNECGMLYADRGKYKTHLQRHTSDEKPFVCHICAHSCRRRDNLRMHLKRIHHLTLEHANAIQSNSGRGQEIMAMTAGDIVTLQPTSPTYDSPMIMMHVGLTPSHTF